jgi:hypothetical protein
MGVPKRSLQKLFEPPKNKTMSNILTFKSKIVLTHPSPNTNPLYFKEIELPYFLSFFNDFHGHGCAK